MKNNVNNKNENKEVKEVEEIKIEEIKEKEEPEMTEVKTEGQVESQQEEKEPEKKNLGEIIWGFVEKPLKIAGLIIGGIVVGYVAKTISDAIKDNNDNMAEALLHADLDDNQEHEPEPGEVETYTTEEGIEVTKF